MWYPVYIKFISCIQMQKPLCAETCTYLALLRVDALANAVNLLVHFCTMMVTLLTSSGNSEGYSTRMPSANTSNLPQPLVSLAR
jgi:hypothetical protein